MALREDLIAEIQTHDKSWKSMGQFYGALSVILRMTVIIGSTLVASDAVKAWVGTTSPLAIPLTSLAVAIAASVEAWAKPRDKWKGFMSVREHSADLVRLCNAAPEADVPVLNDKFVALKEKHLKENVF